MFVLCFHPSHIFPNTGFYCLSPTQNIFAKSFASSSTWPCLSRYVCINSNYLYMVFKPFMSSASQHEDMVFNWSMTLASIWLRNIFNIITYLCLISCCFSCVRESLHDHSNMVTWANRASSFRIRKGVMCFSGWHAETTICLSEEYCLIILLILLLPFISSLCCKLGKVKYGFVLEQCQVQLGHGLKLGL